MKSLEILEGKNGAAKILIDGKEVDGVFKVEVVREPGAPTSVRIEASVTEVRVGS